MKKLLLLFILLLIPMSANALVITDEPVTVDHERISTTCKDARCYYKYANAYEYENGKYKLTGTTQTTTFDMLGGIEWDVDKYYTCKDQVIDECDELYIVFPDRLTRNSGYALTIKIKNGEDLNDIRYLTIGKDYEKVNNKYKLKNISNFDYTDILNRNISHDEHGQFTCLNNETTCDVLYQIDSISPIAFVLISTEKDYVFSKSYKYVDGKVILNDTVEHIWPSYFRFKGLYTCLDKTNECKNGLYLTERYVPHSFNYSGDFIETTDPQEWYLKKVEFPSQTINKKVGNKINSKEYIENPDDVKIIDESIAKIQGNEMIFLRVGETDLVNKENPSTILYHIIVTDDKNNTITNITNPNTGNSLIVIAVVLTILVTYYVLLFIKRKKKML